MIKKHTRFFLLNNMISFLIIRKKEITSDNVWGWVNNKSVKANFILSRHLIISELIINYLLATLVLFRIFILRNKTFNKHKKELS